MDRSVERLVEVMSWYAGQVYTLGVDGKLLPTRRWIKADAGNLEVPTHVDTQIGKVAEHVSLEARLRQSQKMEAVGQLAAGMAHEINNPMAYVRSNMTQLRQALEIDSADAGEDEAWRSIPPDEWRVQRNPGAVRGRVRQSVRSAPSARAKRRRGQGLGVPRRWLTAAAESKRTDR